MAIFNSFLYVYQRVFRSQQGPNSGGTTLNGTGGLRQFSALRSGCRPLGVGHATVPVQSGMAMAPKSWMLQVPNPQSQSDTTSGAESWSPSSPSWQKTLRGTGALLPALRNSPRLLLFFTSASLAKAILLQKVLQAIGAWPQGIQNGDGENSTTTTSLLAMGKNHPEASPLIRLMPTSVISNPGSFNMMRKKCEFYSIHLGIYLHTYTSGAKLSTLQHLVPWFSQRTKQPAT